MSKLTKYAIIIAVVFGAIYASFGLLSPQIWNSPDETAVAFFAKNMAYTGKLWRPEAYNLFQTDTVHPRSILSLDGYLVPGSFYGAIMFFGLFYKLIGPTAYALGTPLLTVLAAFGVFFAMRRLCDERIAFFAEILFLANPIVWYFASRGLYPNLIFVDLAIIGMTMLYLEPWQKMMRGRGNAILGMLIDNTAGMFVLGIAFLVRPVEFIWLFPIAIAIILVGRKKIYWPRYIVWGVIGGAFFGALLFTNIHLYGGPFSSGYSVGSTMPGISVPAAATTSRLPQIISAPRPFVLPFGFHPRLALTNLWNYLVAFSWWLPVLAAIGYLLTKDRSNRRLFGRGFVFTLAILGIYYGSGIFNDSSVSQWTIGSSYLRYFLPAFVLLVPLAAFGVERVSRRGRWVAPAVLAVFIGLGVWTVYFRSPESLVPMHATLDRYTTIKAYVLKETQQESVIVTERSDKVFFPERRVVLNLRDKATLDQLPRLSVHGLYYYGITIAENELPKINKELGDRGLQLGRIKSFDNETLYGITKIAK